MVEEVTMSRSPKNPLRPLLEEERRQLIHLSRCQAAPAGQVARAKAAAPADVGRHHRLGGSGAVTHSSLS